VSTTYLPAGMPAPSLDADGLSKPFWDGLRGKRLLVQRCTRCRAWQFGPEWICHACRSFDVGWEAVEPRGRIFSWERVWHPVHPALKERGPYLVVLVELPQAGGVRMLGNLLGDAMQPVPVGAEVQGVFEEHAEFTLLQWSMAAAD